MYKHMEASIIKIRRLVQYRPKESTIAVNMNMVQQIMPRNKREPYEEDISSAQENECR